MIREFVADPMVTSQAFDHIQSTGRINDCTFTFPFYRTLPPPPPTVATAAAATETTRTINTRFTFLMLNEQLIVPWIVATHPIRAGE